MWQLNDKFFISSVPSFGENIDGTIDADAVFNWGRSPIKSLPPLVILLKALMSMMVMMVLQAVLQFAPQVWMMLFSFLFWEDRRQSPPGCFACFAALSGCGGLVDASSALLLFPLPFLAIVIT